MLVNDELKTIFIHIPKTGGTTISRNTIDNWIGLRGFFNAHTPIHKIKEKTDTAGYKFVTFVRDPYTRFKSMYNYLLLGGYIEDTPMTFALNVFAGKYNWEFTNPMCYFCKRKDLDDLGRVENFDADFERIFRCKSTDIIPLNKTRREDMYAQFPDLRDRVTRLYFEDFIEFGYQMDPFIYKQVEYHWTRENFKKEKNYLLREFEKTGSIFDSIPMIRET